LGAIDDRILRTKFNGQAEKSPRMFRLEAFKCTVGSLRDVQSCGELLTEMVPVVTVVLHRDELVFSFIPVPHDG
jgi:hypothetical protein